MLKKVTLAILYREGGFLMQLRDDLPQIVYPGQWGFFGGHLEPGEDAAAGVRRELLEELGYEPPKLDLYQAKSDGQIFRHFFHGPLTVSLEALQLNEGQDLGLCSVAEIQAGEKYSPRIAQVRSLGKPHQRALLDFIASGLASGYI